MTLSSRWMRIGGLVLHVLIGGLILFAASNKLFFPSPEAVESVPKTGLENQMTLIGAGELVTAILLLVPRTSSLGVLLTSAFWGGAICFHMARQESYVLQSALLLLTWVGAYLRDPRTFASFFTPLSPLGERG